MTVNRREFLRGGISGAAGAAACASLAAQPGAVTRGTLAESAELDIITTEVTAWCFPCGDLVTIKDRPAVCPNCGGYQLQMTGGNELQIKELEVA